MRARGQEIEKVYWMGMRCGKFADIIRTMRLSGAFLIDPRGGRVVGEEPKQRMSEQRECGRA